MVKKLLFTSLSLFSLTLFASCSSSDDNAVAPAAGERSIVVIFENDAHCDLKGYTKMAGLRDAVRDTAYAAVVSSGDFLQGGVVGAISRGQYIMDVMKSVSYDAVAIGNHEFDYKVPRLLELTQGFNAPILCSNFFDMAGKRFFPAYTISTYGNKRVAYVAVLTPDTQLVSENYAFYDDDDKQLYDTRPEGYVQLVQQAVNDARKEGADYVILLSHMGERMSPEDRYTSNDLIASTSGIDAVLDGHTHSVVNTTVSNSQGKPVLLCQTGTKFANIGKLLIRRDGTMTATLLPTAEVNFENSSVTAAVADVNKKVDEVTARVVFHSDVPLRISDANGLRMVRSAETNAGDLVTDAMRYAMKADISCINGGGIRIDINEGDITYRQVVDLLPFDDNVRLIEVTGSTILKALTLGVANLPAESGEFVQVSGMKYTASVSTHTITDAQVLQSDGTYVPLDPNKRYTVAVADYCVTGGGLNGAFHGSKTIVNTNSLYRDYVVDYVVNALGGTIGQAYAQPQGRITIVE